MPFAGLASRDADPALFGSPLDCRLQQHVHFHSTFILLADRGDSEVAATDQSALAVIPKPSDSDKEGLVIGWPAQQADMAELKQLHEEIKGKL